MSTFAASWKTAKTKFETDTGMKKPTETTKVGLGKLSVTFRKSTNIEDSLETLDKLFPSDISAAVGQKKEKEIGSAIIDLDKSADAYNDLLTKTIKEQKDQFGKGTDSLYRDLKILRGSLETCVSAAKRDLAKLIAAREIDESGIESSKNATVLQIKTLKQSLEAAVKKSTVVAQEILKDPSPGTFNSAFSGGKAAREVTQALNNIAKFTLPDDINPHSKNMRDIAMQDKGVYQAVSDLYSKVEGVKARLIPMIKETGTSPADASITKMANNPLLFNTTATSADVIAGTKNFIIQLKEAASIAAGFTW